MTLESGNCQLEQVLDSNAYLSSMAQLLIG